MYTPYGTPVKDRKSKNGQRDDFVYDKNGLRRFHGAFEGGWSAGYYNTVGSKEGWTPRQWSSSKKDSQRATNTIEDYIDDEDDHQKDNKPEIVNVGPEILAKWGEGCRGEKVAFEVLPETQKVYTGSAGIGYDSRLTEKEPEPVKSASKRLTMGSLMSSTKTASISSITPGSGKKRPLLLEDEDDEELYPVTKSLPKLRKERDEEVTFKSKSLVKHKFLTAKQRKEVSGRSLAVVEAGSHSSRPSSSSFRTPSTTTCSDGKLPLAGFILVHIPNPILKKYGLESAPVTEKTLQNQVQSQVDSFLDSLQLSLTSTVNPYKSKLDSKFQLAGSVIEGPKENSARTVVEEWVPSKLLCKRMGVKYDKVREEDVQKEVKHRGGFGKEKVEKMRAFFG